METHTMTSKTECNLIYYAFCSKSAKGYVGKTNNFKRRKSQHLQAKPRSAFHNAIKKYGIDAFVWDILESCLSEDIVDERERYWIIEKKTLYPDGYNIKAGGQGRSLSEAYKEKRRQEEDERIANLNKDFTMRGETCPRCRTLIAFSYNHTVDNPRPAFAPWTTCPCIRSGEMSIVIKKDSDGNYRHYYQPIGETE